MGVLGWQVGRQFNDIVEGIYLCTGCECLRCYGNGAKISNICPILEEIARRISARRIRDRDGRLLKTGVKEDPIILLI